jgi:hypothetical protein
MQMRLYEELAEEERDNYMFAVFGRAQARRTVCVVCGVRSGLLCGLVVLCAV